MPSRPSPGPLGSGVSVAATQQPSRVLGINSPAIVALAGGSAGAGAGSGALAVVRKLAGATSGAASATAALAVVRKLAGVSSGAGAASGALVTVRRLAGASGGAGSATATLAAIRALAGASAGQGASTAVFTVGRRVAGSSAGAGAETATVATVHTPVPIALAGDSFGGSIATGAFTVVQGQSGGGARKAKARRDIPTPTQIKVGGYEPVVRDTGALPNTLPVSRSVLPAASEVGSEVSETPAEIIARVDAAHAAEVAERAFDAVLERTSSALGAMADEAIAEYRAVMGLTAALDALAAETPALEAPGDVYRKRPKFSKDKTSATGADAETSQPIPGEPASFGLSLIPNDGDAEFDEIAQLVGVLIGAGVL